jgi:hypothetical protein
MLTIEFICPRANGAGAMTNLLNNNIGTILTHDLYNYSTTGDLKTCWDKSKKPSLRKRNI